MFVKSCDSELSYLLAELFNMCLKESCFPASWKVLYVVPVLKNVGEISTVKNDGPVSFLSVVSKTFEKLVNNRLVDYLKKSGILSEFHYVLGLLVKLQIFSQLYLIEMVVPLIGLGSLKL